MIKTLFFILIEFSLEGSPVGQRFIPKITFESIEICEMILDVQVEKIIKDRKGIVTGSCLTESQMRIEMGHNLTERIIFK
jgi:hypothetical protein